jgi:hypothetical protein
MMSFATSAGEPDVYELSIPEGEYHVFTQASAQLHRAPLVATHQTLVVDGNTQTFDVKAPKALNKARSAKLRFEDLNKHQWAWLAIYRLDDDGIWQPYSLIRETNKRELSLDVDPGDYAILAVKYQGMHRSYATVIAGGDKVVDVSSKHPAREVQLMLRKGDKLMGVEQLMAPEKFAMMKAVNEMGLAYLFSAHHSATRALRPKYTSYNVLLPSMGDYEFTIRNERGIERKETVKVDLDTEGWDFR